MRRIHHKFKLFLKWMLLSMVVLLFLYAVYVSAFPIRFSINRTVSAQLTHMNFSEDTKEVKVTLQGYYFFYLFQRNRFSGSINIANVEHPYLNVVNFLVGGSEYDVLLLMYGRNMEHSIMLGSIRTNIRMNHVNIILVDD